MRTKSVILGAALLAAGVATSMAQSNVYSLNVVGYVNVPLVTGFTTFANPLDFDGTGTNNTIQGVFGTNLPAGSAVYIWSGGSFGTSYSYGGRTPPYVWSGNAPLNPGEGVFVSCPSPVTITCVGQVLQGTVTNASITTGFSLLGSTVPVQTNMDATGNGGLQYVPTFGDTVYFWDPVGQGWNSSDAYGGRTPPYVWSASGGTAGTGPTFVPGVGYFLSTTAASPSWVTTFAVQ